ncbi:MAG: hypothetical protein AAGB29_10450 [Planctomycetota bacterium]
MQTEGTIDELMEAASRALVALDYVGCERRCVEALGLAEAAGEWAMVAAIVLPLQEARRQRRIVATEGVLRIGEPGDGVWPGSWRAQGSGWWVEVSEASVRRVSAARAAMREAGVLGEVMSAVERAGAWVVCGESSGGRVLEVVVDAPDWAWLGSELGPEDAAHDAAAAWLIEASERLGDAAIAAVDEPMGTVERVKAMEAMVGVFDDHEKLHQAWAEAARAADAAGLSRSAGGGA